MPTVPTVFTIFRMNFFARKIGKGKLTMLVVSNKKREK